MTDLTVSILHAFRTIARAVAETGVNAGLFKHPELISKTVKRRVSAELKRLGILLRRLIFLVALQVELAPLAPRPARSCFEKSKGDPKLRKAFFFGPPPAHLRSAGLPAWPGHCADTRAPCPMRR
ncbi:MAG: hypothetical protein KDA56_16190 [Hyphomonas sp.]|nr:hypothetical protein [Hyphomonas sp.]